MQSSIEGQVNKLDQLDSKLKASVTTSNGRTTVVRTIEQTPRSIQQRRTLGYHAPLNRQHKFDQQKIYVHPELLELEQLNRAKGGPIQLKKILNTKVKGAIGQERTLRNSKSDTRLKQLRVRQDESLEKIDGFEISENQSVQDQQKENEIKKEKSLRRKNPAIRIEEVSSHHISKQQSQTELKTEGYQTSANDEEALKKFKFINPNERDEEICNFELQEKKRINLFEKVFRDSVKNENIQIYDDREEDTYSRLNSQSISRSSRRSAANILQKESGDSRQLSNLNLKHDSQPIKIKRQII